MNWRDELFHVEIKKPAAKRRVASLRQRTCGSSASATADSGIFARPGYKFLEWLKCRRYGNPRQPSSSTVQGDSKCASGEGLHPAAFESGWQRGPVLQLIFFRNPAEGSALSLGNRTRTPSPLPRGPGCGATKRARARYPPSGAGSFACIFQVPDGALVIN